MGETKFRWIYITTKDQEEANSIGNALVEGRLAACVNIIKGMDSIYWWEGKIEKAEEAILIAKTTIDREPQLISKVKAMHSYQVPCIISLPIQEGNPDFLRWIDCSVHG